MSTRQPSPVGDRCHRKRGAALISAVAILLITGTFAALLLSVHTVQLSTGTQFVQRARVDAAARGGLQLALWKVRNDADLQNCVAQALKANDTSFESTPLIQVTGTLSGTPFHTDLWPGPSKVRLHASASNGDAASACWAQVPLCLQLLVNGTFEQATGINTTMQWEGAASLGQWFAGDGISRVDDPRTMPGEHSFNITLLSGNHFAEQMFSKNRLGQIVSGAGVSSTLILYLDYIHAGGNMSVKVRGMDTVAAATTLRTSGGNGLDNWSESGTELYDSGNLPQALTWAPHTATITPSRTYAYYGLFVVIGSNSSTGGTVERAVDNVRLGGF